MPAWPAALPQLPSAAISIRDQDAVVRTPMDAGPPTRRNRYTATARSFTATIIVDGSELETLNTFYRDTLANGATAFDWIDPETSGTVELAFAAPPEKSLIKGGAAPARLWQVVMSLEIQP